MVALIWDASDTICIDYLRMGGINNQRQMICHHFRPFKWRFEEKRIAFGRRESAVPLSQCPKSGHVHYHYCVNLINSAIKCFLNNHSRHIWPPTTISSFYTWRIGLAGRENSSFKQKPILTITTNFYIWKGSRNERNDGQIMWGSKEGWNF